MPNQQIFPQSTYPIVGDVTSTPGNPNVVVTGIQSVPFSPTPPSDGDIVVYDSGAGQWGPGGGYTENISIMFSGIPVSSDYFITINGNDMYIQVNSSYPPNGPPILFNGAAV